MQHVCIQKVRQKMSTLQGSTKVNLCVPQYLANSFQVKQSDILCVRQLCSYAYDNS